MKGKRLVVSIALATALALSATGCSALSKAMSTVADANDEALNTAEFTICRGASIGSILRKYKTEKQVKAWQTMCLYKIDNLIIEVPTNGN